MQDKSKIYKLKEWNEVLERCLRLLNETNPTDERLFVRGERPVVNESFGRDGSTVFCFAYKGAFLPSSNLDGRFWKPSQGVKRYGEYLCKRYFYHTNSEGVKTKRQVIWIETNPEWQIVEYRVGSYKADVHQDHIQHPKNIDWKMLMQLSECIPPVISLLHHCDKRKRKMEPEEWIRIVIQSDQMELRKKMHFNELVAFDEVDPFNSQITYLNSVPLNDKNSFDSSFYQIENNESSDILLEG